MVCDNTPAKFLLKTQHTCRKRRPDVGKHTEKTFGMKISSRKHENIAKNHYFCHNIHPKRK